MKHGYFGRKLGRNKDERKRLFRDLCRVLIEHGRIRTTIAKAKSIQPTVEKLITKAKRATNGSLREITKTLADSVAEKRLIDMSKTRFAGRTSGYTRIIKLGVRVGDAAEMVYLEFVDAEKTPEVVKAPKATKETKSAPKVQEAEVVTEKKPAKTKKVAKAAPSTK